MIFNRAVVGGAVYLSCYDTVLENSIPKPNKCTVQIIGTNIFMNNTAKDGGAIKWTKDRPLIDKNATKFINNTATVYGNDIASYPKIV